MLVILISTTKPGSSLGAYDRAWKTSSGKIYRLSRNVTVTQRAKWLIGCRISVTVNHTDKNSDLVQSWANWGPGAKCGPMELLNLARRAFTTISPIAK